MPQCPRQDDASAAAPGTGLTVVGKRAPGRVFALGARMPVKASEGINFLFVVLLLFNTVRN